MAKIDTNGLTTRQQRILEFIARTVRERGYPPTVREIGEAVGLTSSSSVHAQLANLERRGLLHKDPTKPRAMALEAPRAEGVPVPLLGRIAAGVPVLAEQHVEEYLSVPMGFLDGTDHFALRVAGDSMVGAGILDGDVVVVRRQDDADDGDIVAALVPGPAEDEATVKRLRRSRGDVTLVPENPAFEPLELGPQGRILGKVVAVLRKL
ncbi:MAG TPA: transcriptional repressor LexA [Actinomycetota bacterium]|nr:transcriptional repressor LexA [Actinomycetota bacterium]